MPYAGASPTLTVQALLQQPALLSRELVNLIYKRLVADRLFQRGTSDQVAGGSMRYQEFESIFVDDDPVEVAEGADFPLTDWSETVKTEPVRQYGYAFRATNLAIRRNQRDVINRGMTKLANRLVRFIDSKAMAKLEGAAGIQTLAASALWTTVGTSVLGDVAAAQEKLETKDNGYAGFTGATLVLHTNLRDSLLLNTELKNVLPREGSVNQVLDGKPFPFAGLKEIIFTPQITSTVALLLDTSIAGTIADEAADPAEGWVAYDPGPGFAPVYVKVEPDGKPAVHKRVSAGRWPAIAVVEPPAIVKITGVA
ncbi:hypothetical protein Gocc_2907 [Gaiella occulta]|uniref:Major capsid protein n=1 Tax=Gaiella occulta TaxID=1002870 RepID=A0A7M2YV05_9ACTN|nr:hypothetical protein [Gaiella occulta]RDI73307.1 hypothetical protein Gocc_2907 [Gaiella occulta]